MTGAPSLPRPPVDAVILPGRAAERLGFTLEGLLRQHRRVKERNYDTAVYAILDREWPAIEVRLAGDHRPQDPRHPERHAVGRLPAFPRPGGGGSHRRGRRGARDRLGRRGPFRHGRGLPHAAAAQSQIGEALPFHGTSKDAVLSIAKSGHDPGRTQARGKPGDKGYGWGMLGQGTYLTDSFAKTTTYAGCRVCGDFGCFCRSVKTRKEVARSLLPIRVVLGRPKHFVPKLLAIKARSAEAAEFRATPHDASLADAASKRVCPRSCVSDADTSRYTHRLSADGKLHTDLAAELQKWGTIPMVAL